MAYIGACNICCKTRKGRYSAGLPHSNFDNLSQAAESIFPNKGRSRYNNVHVLLLRWDEDPMGVHYELDDLSKTFRTLYGYTTETWLIPMEQSHFALMKKALQIVQEYGKTGSLLIVYYAGHGTMNSSRQAVWTGLV